jgi:hypothetical protein
MWTWLHENKITKIVVIVGHRHVNFGVAAFQVSIMLSSLHSMLFGR